MSDQTDWEVDNIVAKIGLEDDENIDTLAWGAPSPEAAISTAKPRPCSHPKYKRTFNGTQWACSCGHLIDPAKQKAGKNARSRNLRIQRQRQTGIGIENLPGNGPYDGRNEMFRSESKAMVPDRFPNQLWKWLRGIPVTTETPILIVTDTPGPGLRARSIVVIDYDDWRDLHGGTS